MRYHWGMGIGHTYSHDQDLQSQRVSSPPANDSPAAEDTQMDEIPATPTESGHVTAVPVNVDVHETSSTESEDSENSEAHNSESEDSEDGHTGADESEDDSESVDSSDGDLEEYDTYHPRE